MRFHSSLHLLPLCVLLLASGDAAADVTADSASGSAPVVIAVDASLDPDSRALVDSSIVSIAAALPHDTELGVIVFGDVVLRVVPLAPLRAAQLDEIDKALNAPNDTADGNLAIGLERGIDELSEREAAHLLLFARARTGGADAEDSARFREWYRELLLPDAAGRGIAITLVSPETDVDAAVRADLLAHPANASYSLDGDAGSGTDAGFTRMLLRRILGGTDSTPETPGTETAVPDGDVTGDVAAVTPAATSATTPSITSSTTASSTTASSVTASGANTFDATAVPDAASPDRRRLASYAVAALSLTLMVLLLALLARTRRAGSTAHGAMARSDAPTGGTSSTYLPLHATPTRSFTPAPRSVATSNTPAHGTSAHETSARGTSAHGVTAGDADERTRIRERDATAATRLAPATRERSAAPSATGVPDTPAPWDEHAADTDAAEKETARSGQPDGPDELELLASLTAERNKIDPLD